MRILLPSNLHLQRVSINRPFPLSLSPAALPTLELQWLDLSEHPSISPSSGTLHLKSGESGRIPLPPLLSPLSTCASISGGAPHHEAEGQPMTASATAGAEREVRGDSSSTETVQHEADWSLAREYSHGLISLLQSSAAAAAEVDTEGPAVTLMEARALACICDRALGVLRAARERLAAAQQGAQQWVTTGAAHETGTIKVPWPVQEVSTHRDSACTILIQPEDLSHLPALLAPVVALATPVPAAPAASAAPAPAPAHSPAPPSAVATVPVVAVAPSMSHGASVAHHSLRRDWASSSLHEHHRLLRWADLPLALAAAAAALGPADAAWAAALPPLAAWPLRLPHWEETAAGAGDLVAAEEAVASAVAFGLALMRARSRGQSGSGSSSSSSACGDTLLRTWARAQMRAQPGVQAKEGSQAQAQPQPPLLEALLGAVPPTGGWWEGTVFPGAGAGIDTEQFRVVSLAPLGNPYGSSSPLVPSVPAVAAAVAAAGAAGGESTTQLRWGGSFPLITPADQARAHAVLYSHLGLVSAAVPAPAPTGQAQSQAQARAPDLMYLLPDTLPSGLPPLPSLPRLQGQEQQERGQGRGQSCGQQGQWSWESGWLALGVPPAAGEQGQWMPLSQTSASPSAAAATDTAAAAVASVARTLAPLRVPRCPDAWTAQALGTLSPPLSYAAAVARAVGGSADQLGAVAAAEGGPALLRMLLPEGKVRTLDSDQNTVAETARDWGEVLHHHRPPRNVGNSKSSSSLWTREYGALTDRLSTSPGFAPAPGGSAGRYGSLFGLVGASMGGMQVLSLAASAPGLFPRYLAICSTGKTSPATAALRFVQRTALRQALARGSSAATALDAARLVGVLAYRTRSEFDARFEWSASESGVLECETYLQRAAERFRGVYDPHCYLAMSKLMDLMDLNALGGARRILDSNEGRAAWRSELYLIGIKDDALIPASEMAQLAEELGPSFADRVLYDVVSSPHGHDAFLTQPILFNPRIAHFLDLAASSGTSTVRSYQKEIDEN